VDLQKLRSKMAATIEKQKAEDPKELRRQLAALQVELKKAQAAKSAPAPKVETKIKEVPVLKDTQLKRLEVVFQKMKGEAARHGAAMSLFWDNLNEVATALLGAMKAVSAGQAIPSRHDVATPRPTSPPVVTRQHTSTPVRTPAPVQTRAPKDRPAASADHVLGAPPYDELGKGEQQTLKAIAQYPDGVTREQLTVLTGYKRSTRNTYLQRLAQWGYCVSQGERTVITEQGFAALGDSYEPLPTGQALRDYWMTELPEGEKKILAHLIEAHPNGVEREDLTQLTGYTRSSRNTYIQRLGAKELIETDGTAVKASKVLFE
jgi:uncharacterized protein